MRERVAQAIYAQAAERVQDLDGYRFHLDSIYDGITIYALPCGQWSCGVTVDYSVDGIVKGLELLSETAEEQRARFSREAKELGLSDDGYAGYAGYTNRIEE